MTLSRVLKSIIMEIDTRLAEMQQSKYYVLQKRHLEVTYESQQVASYLYLL
jgi:hypothetical protein